MTNPHARRPDSQADRTDDGAFWFDDSNTPWRPRRPRRGLYGNARLANRADLAPYLDPPADGRRRSHLPLYAALLEKTPDGSALEPIVYSSLALPEDVRTRHILAVGQTGCGKTTRLIYPLIASDLAQRRTVIAFDAKGRKVHPLVQHLAAHHRPGQKVHLLNFRDPQRSARWNPLASIKTEGEAHAIAFKICTLVDRGGEREGAFWLNNSIDLLSGILWALSQDPKEKPTLGRAREVAHMPISDFSHFAGAHPNVAVLERVCELYSDAHQTGACVFQDLRMRLSGFLDERVAASTGTGGTAIDLDSLLTEGGILVIEVNETDVAQLRQVINLFVNHVFARIFEVAARSPKGRLPLPCSLFLDEFCSAVGKIDDMEVRINTVRERGVNIVAAVQSVSQMGIYGTSAPQVLAGFASKLFFAGLEWSDAEYASRLAGVTTVCHSPSDYDEEGDDSAVGITLPRIPVARALLLPEEVARPVKHPVFGPPATLFLADTPPVPVYLQPAYELPLLARFMEQSAPEDEDAPEEQPEESPADRLKRALGWDSASAQARTWWEGQQPLLGEREVAGTLLEQVEGILAVWRKLHEPRGNLLEELMLAARQSGCRQPMAHVCFLQYRLLKRHEEEQRNREA